MKEAFEKIRKRMEKATEFLSDCTKYGNKDAVQQRKSYDTMYMYEIALLVEELIDIVYEVESEFNNGWIPCSERLPSEEETKDCASFIVTKRVRDKFSIIDFCLFGTEGEWLVRENEEVIAWMPLPSPYKEGDRV